MINAARKVISHAQIRRETPRLNDYITDTASAQRRAEDVRGFVIQSTFTAHSTLEIARWHTSREDGQSVSPTSLRSDGFCKCPQKVEFAE